MCQHVVVILYTSQRAAGITQDAIHTSHVVVIHAHSHTCKLVVVIQYMWYDGCKQ